MHVQYDPNNQHLGLLLSLSAELHPQSPYPNPYLPVSPIPPTTQPILNPRRLKWKDLRVPSWRILAGIYVSTYVDSRRRWKSAIKVLSSKGSVAWGDTVTLSSYAPPTFSVEIRASYEAD
ncbi:hypothetical protein EV702DRAFT_1193269 [Suillus placidus]|uniref:Uncharacterized protein n=1 Tax=Suillus placidus TaxID=48579 RepID=A0A9P7A3J5_9AGAM|nr:hypothetical protein EV702DRAFT_1193269 [Suillus placidus]